MYALAIHGGAGAAPRDRSNRGHEAQFLEALARALDAGEQVLRRDGSALDAVEASVIALEDDPLFNAGRGAVLNSEGTVELDAAIMSGTDLRAGAVTGLRSIRNPIALARRVLERSPHVFLAGAGAERFAEEQGFPRVANDYFVTAHRSRQLQALQAAADPAANARLDDPPLGTVGAVARDTRGVLAAATSTGGMAGKHPGRVGDSPVIGAGTYADNRSCAVSTTGHGEWFLRTVQAYDLAARMTYGGQTLDSAAGAAIARLTALQAHGGLIAVDAAGRIVMPFNTPAMFRASVRQGQSASVAIY
jgi:L-asparaginase / beta-aspartyl-peptidase